MRAITTQKRRGKNLVLRGNLAVRKARTRSRGNGSFFRIITSRRKGTATATPKRERPAT